MKIKENAHPFQDIRFIDDFPQFIHSNQFIIMEIKTLMSTDMHDTCMSQSKQTNGTVIKCLS